jgi:hypothetical protein
MPAEQASEELDEDPAFRALSEGETLRRSMPGIRAFRGESTLQDIEENE